MNDLQRAKRRSSKEKSSAPGHYNSWSSGDEHIDLLSTPLQRRRGSSLARLSEENVEILEAEYGNSVQSQSVDDLKRIRRGSILMRHDSKNVSNSVSEENIGSMRDNVSSSIRNEYRMPTGRELDLLLNRPEPMIPQAPVPELGLSQDGSQCCTWVENDFFLGLTALVICFNTGMVVLEEKNPDLKDRWRMYESVILAFYCFELVCRMIHTGPIFFTGRIVFVMWNWLDLMVVFCGVLDQWVLPVMVKDWKKSPLITTTVRLFRTARLLRVLRLARIAIVTNFEWANHPRFETFIALVIAFNGVVMGFETDLVWDGWYWIEQGLLFIFVFELSVRLKRVGWHKFCCGLDMWWNWLDLLIVLSGVVDQWVLPIFNLFDMQGMESEESSHGQHIGHLMTLLRMLRLMRILRLLRLVKTVRPLYHLAMGVLEAMQGMFWVTVLTTMLLYGFAILLTRLIGHGLMIPFDDPDVELAANHFATVEQSMFTLFRVMNGDVAELRPLFAVSPFFCAIFVIFMVASSWSLLSILTAVVSDNMIAVTQQQNTEIKEEERQIVVNKLGEIITKLDIDENGEIGQYELENFLENPDCAEKCKQLKISMLDADDVWRALQRNGVVETSEYLEGLSMALRPISEKSLMRIQGKLKNMASTGCFVDVAAREEIWDMREELHDQLELLRRIASIRRVTSKERAGALQKVDVSVQTDPESDDVL
eukprot:gnl/MRDRNA2_/MRDRNA2_27984_c0_seq1.p1 gnl/MRDRNA2_/MRDRNA2_27984_c0~~gnl/MRDRNA2_/MRDRNA2_27984_c0_seq1.p1  ORF type:complete len:708 (+),score=112.85 gnl/MRDRNA2_/MRDRNA2_27984_c0_seq1:131-2254(+)